MARSLAFASAMLALAAFGCEPTPPDLPARPPNIVFILIDDLGWADLPAYGNAFHETPQIDRLAAQGMLFTNAYAAAPVCSPTRASIQSGQYPARLGITDFITGHWRPFERLTVPRNRTQYLPLEIITVAEALKAEGYKTAYFGKWHLGNPEVTPANQGYDHGFYRRGGGHFDVGRHLVPPQDVDPEDNLTEVITEHSLAFMEEFRDQPFFLMMSHYAVHIPLQARQELIEKYEQKEKPEHGINNPIYAAMIEHVDQSVGAVLDKLDELELADDTVVTVLLGQRRALRALRPVYGRHRNHERAASRREGQPVRGRHSRAVHCQMAGRSGGGHDLRGAGDERRSVSDFRRPCRREHARGPGL